MARPDPIQYAERLYGAIRAANFSPISFLAFGNAIKDGVAMRNMPRIAAEPFMRIVGEMLDLEGDIADADRVAETLTDAETAEPSSTEVSSSPPTADIPTDDTGLGGDVPAVLPTQSSVPGQQRRRTREKH